MIHSDSEQTPLASDRLLLHHGDAVISGGPNETTPQDEHERRLLVGGRRHRRADADELVRVVDADTSFRAATRILPG